MSRYFPRTLTQWIGAAVATAFGLGCVAFVGAWLVAWSGVYNVSVTAGHLPGATTFLGFARLNSIDQYADGAPEPPERESLMNEVSLQRAAGHYAGNCMFCHGGPGFSQNETVKSMMPAPPPLTDATERFSDKELFWIVANGFKFSGMPKWPAPGRSDEIWDMVALLKQMPELDKEAFTRLAYGPVAGQRGAVKGQAQGDGQGDGQGDSRNPQSGGVQQASAQQASAQQASAEPAGKLGHGLAIMSMTANRAAGMEELRLIANCARCHATDGQGRDSGAFPILGLQSETYLKAALDAYASGQRHSGYMASIASQLSPQERIDLAEYYAAQPGDVDQTVEVDAATLERGRQIAMEGTELAEGAELNLPREMIQAEEDVLPSCVSCHAQMPGKDRPLVPRLAGQYKEYLVRQLETWKFRDRGEGTREGYVMQSVAHALPAEDIEAVAAWWASREEPVDYTEREVEEPIGQ